MNKGDHREQVKYSNKRKLLKTKAITTIFYFIGKTVLCEIICRKAGIELLVEPLSSSELNRSKVGETEQLLMDLFRRAEYLPHLLCCIVSKSLLFFLYLITFKFIIEYV